MIRLSLYTLLILLFHPACTFGDDPIDALDARYAEFVNWSMRNQAAGAEAELAKFLSVYDEVDWDACDAYTLAAMPLALGIFTPHDPNPNVIHFLSGHRDAMLGASAAGELLNQPAPDSSFFWTTDRMENPSLKAYRGRPVVLDFWAVWCMPCILSFEQLRALQDRYEDSVVILGVTQLTYIPPDDDAQSMQNDDDVASARLRYLRTFIEKHDMTWSVAVSEDGSLEADFAVRGIPHIAIIDQNGIVRHNRVRSFEALCGMLDALLAETQ